ncbi:hypothetical protein ACLE20_09840 [Rhizobium sp. YIM 134829]|uniref:hypothetical protein n=1 Tax=Rhizobium sp. YIM 134829 TaxID=3390453 RepID=UPI003978D40F
MRSIVNEAEERRLQEEEARRKFPKTDEFLAAKTKRSQSHEVLNDKINAHFFGAQKYDDEAMQALIGRFTATLGLQREKDELGTDFAQRLSDALVVVDHISPTEFFLPPPMQRFSLARFSVSVEELKAALDPARKGEPRSDMAKTIARLVERLGIEPQGEQELDVTYSERVGRALADYRKPLVWSTAELEKKSGLRDLGFTAKDMIEAIANPSGDTAKAIQEALDKQVREEKFASKDMTKVIQRLEEAADPKTVAELKLERTDKSDPTKVEDAETKKEREEQIHALEASEKLEDVEKARKAVEELNEALGKLPESANDKPDAPASPDVVSNVSDLLVALAAGAEAAQRDVEQQQAADAQSRTAVQAAEAAEAAVDESAGKSDETKQAEAETKQTEMIARAGPGGPGTAGTDEEGAGILPVSVDENGIYEMLKRKAEAAAAKAPAASPVAA